jgi:hypothetical protein
VKEVSYQFRSQLISRATRFAERCLSTTKLRASITELRASGIQQRFSIRLVSGIVRSRTETLQPPPTTTITITAAAAAATTTTTNY